MTFWSRCMAWLCTPRAKRVAQRKRELQRLCQQCGISKAKATEIASRYFKEVAK